MNRPMLEIVIKDRIKTLTNAIALSARRGAKTFGMPEMIVKLTLWLKSGRNDFTEWDNLCQQSSEEWAAWYDEYKGDKS